jgi:hypothetical protein
MHVIIRLSKAGLKAELKADAAKPYGERLNPNNSGEYQHDIRPETPEQRAIVEALELKELDWVLTLNKSGFIRLGNFVPSTITRQPLIVPIAYDAPPTDDDAWQQLAVMASQRSELVNPSGMVF